MQDVQLYIGGSLSLSGTITFSTSSTLSDSGNNFNSYPWIVGQEIVNNTNGKIATVVSIFSNTSIVISMSVVDFGQGTDSFTINQKLQLADTFKDETISLTQSIKNTKDIGKILTNFTKSFTLPASKKNNKIFNHFYRADVQNGFDARLLVPANIKLNGIDFENGKIRLLGVKMKDNKPNSYKVSFVGNTVSLKVIFGADQLSDLPYLDAYNHTYSYTNIRNYMEDGFNPTGDGTGSTTYPELMYPFISTSKNRYYYNTDETDNSQPHIPNVRNIFNDGTPASNDHQDYRAIQFFDLKPAIKVYNILKAIEEKYGFTFSNDFFRVNILQSGKPNVDGLFGKLYMFCNRKAGSLIDIIDEDSAEVKLEELTFDTGTEVRQSNDTSLLLRNDHYLVDEFKYEAYITTLGGGFYDIELYDVDTNEVYYSVKNTQSAQYLFEFEFKALFNQPKNVKPSLRIKTKGGVTSFTVDYVKLTRTYYAPQRNEYDPEPDVTVDVGEYDKSSITLSSGINFRNKILPKVKVIDFMTNLFKMFNLVAYFEGTELVVKTLDQYYLNDNTQEFYIDKYVDISSSEVNRSEVYSEINYEYKEPNTMFAINSNEATNDEYGNERFKSEEGISFDGKKYDVKSSFGHMIYENLVNNGTFSVSGTVTSTASTYITDSNQNFNAYTWVTGSIITNNTTGGSTVVRQITDSTTVNLFSNIFSVGDSYTVEADEGAFSGITFGHTVSQDNSPVIDGGSLFLSTRRDLPTNIWVTDKVVGVNSSSPQELDTLYVPANVYTGFGVGVRSINFGSEFDEFTNSEEQDGLFKTYHQNFILNIYDTESRLIKITAHLPLSILLKYELNDRFIFQGRKYLINSIKTNLQTGKSELELLTDNYGT